VTARTFHAIDRFRGYRAAPLSNRAERRCTSVGWTISDVKRGYGGSCSRWADSQRVVIPVTREWNLSHRRSVTCRFLRQLRDLHRFAWPDFSRCRNLFSDTWQ